MPLNADSGNDTPAPGEAASGAEHRRGRRRRMLKAGKIIVSDTSMIDCTIRDISDGGARIVFGAPTQLPEGFWLMIVSDARMVPAERLWQRGLAAGIRFTGPERAAPPIMSKKDIHGT
jgi:hypothetical protein